MQEFDNLKETIESKAFFAADIKEKLLGKIEYAEHLYSYWEKQTEDSRKDPFKKGFILQSNFPIKKFMEDIWIQEMCDAILQELETLLQAEPDNEDCKTFKTDMENYKKLFKTTIENVRLPQIDLKSTLNMFNWIPGSDRVLFYSEVDLSAIVNRMLEELLKIHDKVKFNIQLPPPSTKEEQDSVDNQIKRYAEMIFKNCVEKGLDPKHVTLTINGRNINPEVMFANEFAEWTRASTDKFKEKLAEAKKIEEPFIQHSTHRSP